MEQTRNCQTTADRLADRENALQSLTPEQKTQTLLSSNDYLRDLSCRMDRDRLNDGGSLESHPSALKYTAANFAVALGGFFSIFGLTFLLPALIRRYRKWLNT
jgi:hypothetical protein